MVLHEILLTSHFAVVCRRQSWTFTFGSFLRIPLKPVGWQALPDQLGLMGFPMIFSLDKKKTLMAYPVWFFFFLRREMSRRVSPPFASPIHPQLFGSEQTTSSCPESPELFFVLAQLRIEAERKALIFKRYLHIIRFKNWYILIASRERRT